MPLAFRYTIRIDHCKCRHFQLDLTINEVMRVEMARGRDGDRRGHPNWDGMVTLCFAWLPRAVDRPLSMLQLQLNSKYSAASRILEAVQSATYDKV